MTEAEKTREAIDALIEVYTQLAQVSEVAGQQPPPEPPPATDWKFDTSANAIQRAHLVLQKHGITTLQLRTIDRHPLIRNQEKIKARKAFFRAAAPGKEEDLEALYTLMIWVQRLRLDISEAAEKKPWLRDKWGKSPE
jgi:hypothetical protein